MITLTISGMTCHHCAARVERALRKCSGVERVIVDLANGTAVVVGSGLDEAELRAKVADAGYEVTGTTTTP